MKRFTALVLITLLASAAQAQKATPGLWEQTVKMKGGEMDAAMAEMQQQLARMSPAERKQMEAMMGAQGQGMGMMAGKPTTLRVCITPEQAARDEMPQADRQCSQTSQQRSGNTLSFKFVCTGPDKASGEGNFTFDSDKAHHGRVVVTSLRNGKPERMEIEQSGRWVAADCGNVKPVGK